MFLSFLLWILKRLLHVKAKNLQPIVVEKFTRSWEKATKQMIFARIFIVKRRMV